MIGTVNPCIVISQSDLEELLKSHDVSFTGKSCERALTEAAAKLGFDIELPARNQDHARPVFENYVIYCVH